MPPPSEGTAQETDEPSTTPTKTTPTPTATPSPAPTKTRTPSPTPTKVPAAKKTVPGVINLSQQAAMTKLRAAGFKSKVSLSGTPSDEGCTRVLDQNPAASTSWPVDRYVTIVVEQGIPCGEEPSDAPTPTPTPSAT